jgi:hypothetical protein
VICADLENIRLDWVRHLLKCARLVELGHTRLESA